jgi:hypothetical protein
VDLAINNDKRRTTMATVTNTNASVKSSNGLGAKTTIIKLAKSNMTATELNTAIIALTQGGTYSGVTNDAFSIAGITSDGGDAGTTKAFVTGESDVVFIALQGTGTINADASNALGVTSFVLTIESTFDNLF